MMVVGNCLVSQDIGTVCFRCDLKRCGGLCCVEGDAGAPLEEDEIGKIESILPKVEPFMEERAVEIVRDEGFWTRDEEGTLCTNIIEQRECVFVCYEDGKALCALEKAFRAGCTDFVKPISCHLYPIRVRDYGEFKALNYHSWQVCASALCNDRDKALYKVLKEPLIRKFSEQWYKELEEAIEQGLDY
ncbi:MAG TPA: DUF3109 family protein [Candidatus Onthomorpha intestinigallinarum]|uniref:DUF3109 family protein n=1 Tax=Candidatus Onthomorpha intestinigallinarum TaxID=2840880 RepID=A0A9D1UHZ8_9BACT|nr:DUF3109 family protein [Candidatus Onthomorpha intestinigallinarum]